MRFIFFTFILLISNLAIAQSDEKSAKQAQMDAIERSKPLWEYGAGFGFIRYEHYATSDEFTNLFLPFPTFQYRGPVLRADDREGARLYFLKGDDWYIELSGSGAPALDSSKNSARDGMEDLPWTLSVGPQYVSQLSDNLDLKLAFFQAVSTDFSNYKFAGTNYRLVLAYKFEQEFSFFHLLQKGSTQGHFHFKINGGSREYLSTYFDVPLASARAHRPAYEARSGLLGYHLSYFESWNSGRASLYLGGEISKYDISINRQSSLHRSDTNITWFAGLTYTLGESEKRSVPEDETRGLIKKLGPWAPRAE